MVFVYNDVISSTHILSMFCVWPSQTEKMHQLFNKGNLRYHDFRLLVPFHKTMF